MMRWYLDDNDDTADEMALTMTMMTMMMMDDEMVP
jgi:hypothetical protein